MMFARLANDVGLEACHPRLPDRNYIRRVYLLRAS